MKSDVCVKCHGTGMVRYHDSDELELCPECDGICLACHEYPCVCDVVDETRYWNRERGV